MVGYIRNAAVLYRGPAFADIYKLYRHIYTSLLTYDDFILHQSVLGDRDKNRAGMRRTFDYCKLKSFHKITFFSNFDFLVFNSELAFTYILQIDFLWNIFSCYLMVVT